MITILGLALGAVFLLVPLCIAYVCHVNVARKALVAFVKMLLRIGVSGGAVYFLLQANSLWLSLAFALLLVAYSVMAVCAKARLRVGMFLIPVGAGMLASVVLSGGLLLFANIAVGDDFCVRYVLPVVALLAGGMVEPVGKSLATYYMGLRHDNHLYYYLIGNGLSRADALRYLRCRAIEQSFVPGMRMMSTMGVGVPAAMMWSMVMCGRTALEAACWQILVTLGVFASSVVAVVVALAVARRYVLDGYARIKALVVICCASVALCSCGDVVRRIDKKISESEDLMNGEVSLASFEGSGVASTSETTSLEIPARLVKVPEQILRRTGYTVSYNSERRVPNWVAWHLTAAHLKGNVKRSESSFHEDMDVPEPRAVDFDYVRSGYDRGHMCPAGDNKWSQKAMEQSFLFTNVCPQAPSLNRGDWNEMEQACRKWARKYGDLYIVCGPIFYKKRPKVIGKNKVAVPDAFFKVVLSVKDEPKAIGFIYKNTDGNRPKGDYANSVDEVERVTGIDFFPSLPDKIERKVEAQCNTSDWDI